MKNIIILIIALQIVTASAQDFEPSSATFTLNNQVIKISANDDMFKQSNFMLGWQWGAKSLRLNKALKVKQRHAESWIGINDIDSSYDLIITSPGYTHCVGAELLNARGIQYEPTLLIDSPGTFKTRAGDTTKPVFGFKNIKGEIKSEIF